MWELYSGKLAPGDIYSHTDDGLDGAWLFLTVVKDQYICLPLHGQWERTNWTSIDADEIYIWTGEGLPHG